MTTARAGAAAGPPWPLAALNAAAPDDARLRGDLGACCAAAAWIESVLAGRPYPDEQSLLAASEAATAALDDAGLAQAIAAHPRIGERPSGPNGQWSRQEQSGVSGDDIRARLAAANAEYEQRFDQVYLVCATGRSGDELLAICRARLGNDAATERSVVLGELARINRIRLAKLLHAEAL
ncbi:MAG: 2-oxo-4-hydroxy-4-carboxy-5-ureidoimidazoline decarboxylase [Jatrophihabitantaceae bacterium]